MNNHNNSFRPKAPARRQFAVGSLALGAAVLVGARGAKAAESNSTSTSTASAPAPMSAQQASGPIVLHGASPRLTLHAIDTFHGMAASGLRVDFSRQDDQGWVLLRSFTTNANGRSDEPLMLDDSYRAGRYELLLHVDEYFAGKKVQLPRPAFLSKVPLRFQIVNAANRLHLPVQFGPWSYTYSRGS